MCFLNNLSLVLFLLGAFSCFGGNAFVGCAGIQGMFANIDFAGLLGFKDFR